MSFLAGGGKTSVKPQYTGYQVQTSSSVVAMTLLWGENRIAPNVFWYDDFKANPQKQHTGKGGSDVVTSYNYSASLLMGLCQGPIRDVVAVYKDQTNGGVSYTSLGMSLFLGSMTQTPWGYLVANHAAAALAYPGTAYLAVANYDLGGSASLSGHNMIVQGLRWGTQVGGAGDADPALIITDFLSDPIYSVGFPMSFIESATLLSGPDATTTGDSAYQTYCRAMGFGLSPALTNQDTADNVVSRWMQLTNSDFIYTGYSVLFAPYGDTTVTGNGVTYLPNNTSEYTLTDDDLVYAEGADPITMTRVDPADAYNSWRIQFRDRSNQYNQAPIEWRDQALVDTYGLRQAGDVTADEVCVGSMASVMVTLLGQRGSWIRNQYKFTVSSRHSRIIPRTVLTCVDQRLGTFNCSVLDVEENDNGDYDITAEDYPGSVGHAPGFSTQPVTNTPNNMQVPASPVNPPVLLEPRSDLTGGTPQLWAAVSGGDGTTADPKWGGCFVWISADAWVTSELIGTINTPARQGKLTATLASYGGSPPDSTHTLAVDMTMSGGVLDSVTSGVAADYVTLCYVDGELLSYQTSTLTSAEHFALTVMYRGLYGTTAGNHSSGTQFARLDNSTFKYNLLAKYIGVTLHLKFQSFNVWGGGTQDISTCVDYTVSPAGTGFGGGTGGVPTTPTGVAASASGAGVSVTWTTNPSTDSVTLYEIWRAAGTGASFGSASKIATSTVASYIDPTSAGTSGLTYFVIARNVVGPSANSSGASVTATVSTGALWGFAFEKDIATAVTGQAFIDFVSQPPWTIPVSMPLSSVRLSDDGTAPTAQTDFDLQVGGVSVGTIRFAASSFAATFIKASSTAVPANGKVQIFPPASINGMVGRVYGSIAGTR